MSKDFSKLTRNIHSIPDYIKDALEEHGAMNEFEERPAYQQNDYVGWIERAKQNETKIKRLNQMLEELKIGGVYMKMDHPPSRKN